MKSAKGKLKTCSRGHEFYKSSDCPVCPKCWSGYYKKRALGDFPERMGAPALRALRNARITTLKQLARFTEAEILALHGVGPKAVTQLKTALRARRMAFAKKRG
jgi:predicted RecB family nuclease